MLEQAGQGGPGIYIGQVVAQDYRDMQRQLGDAQALAALGGRRRPVLTGRGGRG